MVIKYAENDQSLSMTVTKRESIENSISTIASTPYASAPFLRSMGIKNYPPEYNSDISKNKYAAEVITQCGIWEDRASVTAVYCGKNNDIRMVLSSG